MPSGRIFGHSVDFKRLARMPISAGGGLEDAEHLGPRRLDRLAVAVLAPAYDADASAIAIIRLVELRRLGVTESDPIGDGITVGKRRARHAVEPFSGQERAAGTWGRDDTRPCYAP
jgi:hypothetical protein